MANVSFEDLQKQIKQIKDALGDLKTITDQLNKARSVVCTIVNNTDLTLVRSFEDVYHGAFGTAPPTVLLPRTAGAFTAQSVEGGVWTGTAGTVHYAGGGMLLRCGWEVPGLPGSNSCSTDWTRDDGTGREPLNGRYWIWDDAAGGTQKVPMDFTVSQVPEQYGWRFCRHCNLLFYDGYPQKGVCAKPLPTARFNPGKIDPHFRMYTKPSSWASTFAAGGMDTSINGSTGEPAPPAAHPVARRQHEAADFVFLLGHTFPPKAYQQAGWRFCKKCSALFYDGFPENGICPGGGAHDAAGLSFVLTNDTPVESWGPEQQPGWRFCQKCYGVFFGYHNPGVCAGGGGHEWNVAEQPPVSRHFILNHAV